MTSKLAMFLEDCLVPRTSMSPTTTTWNPSRCARSAWSSSASPGRPRSAARTGVISDPLHGDVTCTTDPLAGQANDEALRTGVGWLRRRARSLRLIDTVRLVITPEGREDYESWSDERKILQRLNRMIDEATRDAGAGIGKPERLSGDLAGFWSRRIDQEHRLVYTVLDGDLVIVQARYHY